MRKHSVARDDSVGSYGLYLWPLCTEGFLTAAGYMHECTRLEILFPFFYSLGFMLEQMDFCSLLLFFSSAGKTLSSGNIYSLIHESPILHFCCRKAREKRLCWNDRNIIDCFHLQLSDKSKDAQNMFILKSNNVLLNLGFWYALYVRRMLNVHHKSILCFMLWSSYV